MAQHLRLIRHVTAHTQRLLPQCSHTIMRMLDKSVIVIGLVM